MAKAIFVAVRWSASWSTDRADVPNEILIISTVVTREGLVRPARGVLRASEEDVLQ